MKSNPFVILLAAATLAIMTLTPARAQESLTQLLAQTPVFAGVSEDNLAKLAKAAKLVQTSPETQLIQVDSKLDKLFIIQSGQADVVLPGGQVVASVGAGVILGEMEFVDHQPAAAEVVMAEDGAVVEIPMADLRSLLNADPALGYLVMENIARKISLNLRDMQ